MSALTKVEINKGHAAMSAMVKALIPSLTWRHHGIGVLQGYVSEGVDPEVRVHIWAPSLVKDGMRESGDIHDHRFDMVSHVIAGHIPHEEWFTHPDSERALGTKYTILRLTHARAAAGNKFHGPTESTGERLLASFNPMTISAGFTYRFPMGHFHRTPIHGSGFAVTLVEKHNQRNVSARILHPIDKEPVMAFGHDMDYSQVQSVISQALMIL